jgi:hypothetical protein
MSDHWRVRFTFAVGAVAAVAFSVIGHYAPSKGFLVALAASVVIGAPGAAVAAAIGGKLTPALKRKGLGAALLLGIAVALATLVLVPVLFCFAMAIQKPDALGASVFGIFASVLIFGREAVAFGAVSGVVARSAIVSAQPLAPPDVPAAASRQQGRG